MYFMHCKLNSAFTGLYKSKASALRTAHKAEVKDHCDLYRFVEKWELTKNERTGAPFFKVIPNDFTIPLDEKLRLAKKKSAKKSK